MVQEIDQDIEQDRGSKNHHPISAKAITESNHRKPNKDQWQISFAILQKNRIGQKQLRVEFFEQMVQTTQERKVRYRYRAEGIPSRPRWCKLITRRCERNGTQNEVSRGIHRRLAKRICGISKFDSIEGVRKESILATGHCRDKDKFGRVATGE